MSELTALLKNGFPGIPEKDLQEYIKDQSSYKPRNELSPNVPRGSLAKITVNSSLYYPHKRYEITVYTPNSNEKSSKSLFILDGSSFLAEKLTSFSFSLLPILDNLIYLKKIPPITCFFIDPSSDGPGYPIYGGTDNRSVEYDTASDNYANFLTEEVIPKLKSQYHISDNPEDRAIMGASSGGSAAFGVAWHRPDQFSKVISSIGSFVNIRGADKYIDLVRKSEKKPIKIYLQDGKKDLNTIFGDWKLANEQLVSSLEYKGYDFIFNQGEGGHNYYHFYEVIDDALIWLWSN